MKGMAFRLVGMFIILSVVSDEVVWWAILGGILIGIGGLLDD